MISKLSRDIEILPSICHMTGKAGIPEILDIFMDTAGFHAEALGVGVKAMSKDDLFWIVSKTKLRFIRHPEPSEKVTASTWIYPSKNVRCERHYSLTSGDEPLVLGKSIWAVLNLATGKIHPLKDLYPKELDTIEPNAVEEPFSIIKREFSDCETVGAYKVRSVDIDQGGHMNNVNYVRALFGCFSLEYLKAHKITELEIHYLNQCFEGDTITFKKRKTENSTQIGAVLNDGSVAVVIDIK